MSSTFSGLNSATSGLLAQQEAMNVVGHNIANANNAAYRRQQVVMSSRYLTPMASGVSAGALGSGTDVSAVRRMKDDFVDSQLLSSTQDMGRWQAGKDALDQVVAIVGEPSDTGLSSTLDKFWNAWQDVSQNPASVGSRSTLVAAGSSVASSISTLYTRLEAVRTQQDKTIKGDVDTINSLTSQIAAVNDQIQKARGAGATPNDLQDKRDDLVSQLASITDIQVHGDGGSSDVISIGGHVLVQGITAEKLASGTDSGGHATVLWADDSSTVQIQGGSLGGTISMSRDVIPGYLTQVDALAKGIMDGVNAVHKTGYGLDGTNGRDFFTGAGASDMRVNAALVGDPRLVGTAATANATGDGSVALSIAKLKNQAVIGQFTIGDAYASFVSKTAGDASSMSDRLDSQSQIHAQLTTQQQSVSGVSLDEEMSDMVRFQQAYSASARVLTTIDSMITTLINQVGAR